jgi:large subunit ribosomal protein L15
MIELHELNPGPEARTTRNKRVGRGPGSGKGKTSGKGHKGSQARAGHKYRAGFEGGQMPLHRRLPKRGFHHESRWPCAVVNLDVLEEHFEAGAEITPEAIVKAGLAKPRVGGIKVLGRGELTKKFTLKVQAISAGARARVESAGGAVEILPATAGKEKE